MEAYVFIECDDDPTEVVRSLRDLMAVKKADGLFGGLEIIALIEAPDLAALDQVIIDIRDIAGVEFTDTRLVRDIS